LSPGETIFLQIALRDTTGTTLAWNTNGGAAGPGSLGLGAFFIRFTGVPGIAVNPSPTAPTNARLVHGANYGTVTSGTFPPAFTQIGGLLNFGFEPGDVPNPANQNRIPLFNLRIVSVAAGSGAFTLGDPNPALSSVDNAVLLNADISGVPNPGTFQSIDQLLFGPTSTNVYSLPYVLIPEPSGFVLTGLAVAGLAWRAVRRRSAEV
jgi:hypothetical protein